MKRTSNKKKPPTLKKLNLILHSLIKDEYLYLELQSKTDQLKP